MTQSDLLGFGALFVTCVLLLSLSACLCLVWKTWVDVREAQRQEQFRRLQRPLYYGHGVAPQLYKPYLPQYTTI